MYLILQYLLRSAWVFTVRASNPKNLAASSTLKPIKRSLNLGTLRIGLYELAPLLLLTN
jgi:hypothetical protein